MRRPARVALSWIIVAVAASLAAGCALPPAPASPHAPPASTSPAPAAKTGGVPPAHVGTTASGGTITVNGTMPDTAARVPMVATVPDSTPSPEALAVLATIPDPLGRPTPGTDLPSSATARPTTPPVARPTVPPATAAPRANSAAADSALGDSTSVPTPEPTQPLGDRSGSRVMPETPATPPPTSAPPSSGTGAAGAAGAASATAAAPVSPDSCWRVQFAAKPDRALSEKLEAAAESQLELPMVIEREQGLYKVRTRDCMSQAAADALRKRAVAAGFEGAFKLRKK